MVAADAFCKFTVFNAKNVRSKFFEHKQSNKTLQFSQRSHFLKLFGDCDDFTITTNSKILNFA